MSPREQPAAVLRVRQMVSQRGIVRAVRLDLRGQILHQIRQAVAILGLVCIENLRLQIAALLRGRRRRQQQQRRRHQTSDTQHLPALPTNVTDDATQRPQQLQRQ